MNKSKPYQMGVKIGESFGKQLNAGLKPSYGAGVRGSIQGIAKSVTGRNKPVRAGGERKGYKDHYRD